MGIGSRPPRRPVAAINVTPLVDVVLVLLIIFLAIAPTTEPLLGVALPGVVHDPRPRDDDDQIVISLAADGRARLGDQLVTDGELRAGLRRELARRRDRIVFFRADPEALYGRAVAVLDIAKGAGAETIGTVVETGSGGEDDGT